MAQEDLIMDIVKVLGLILLYSFYGWLVFIFNRMYNDADKRTK